MGYTIDAINKHNTQEFIDDLKGVVDYWDKHPTTSREKLKGCVFSILAIIDGESASGRAYHLIPTVPGMLAPSGIDLDIAGNLHNEWYK